MPAGGLNSDTFVLRKLLTGEAKPAVTGFRHLYDYAGHIYYTGGAWLSSVYRLMLALDPEGFVKLLDEIRSPLMFDILAAAMLFSDFDEELYAPASRAGVRLRADARREVALQPRRRWAHG